MCQIPEEMKYDFTLAKDEQAATKIKEIVYKFDDQPMSAFQLDGSIYIDDFEFGYEYPIGIGMWYTYCTVDEDCPLFNKPDRYNRTQVCVPALNPGKTFHSYDNAAQGWIALFINMACLYWWETAHRYTDFGATSPNDLGSDIAWVYGMINITFLTYISEHVRCRHNNSVCGRTRGGEPSLRYESESRQAK